MHQNTQNLVFSLLAASVLLFSSCASTGKKEDRTSMCKERYESAEKDFKNGKYSKIQDPLEEILSLCPGTGYMEQTQFLLAESYFNEEDWLEARGEYGSFILNFPSSPYIETAEYRKAVSSYKMDYTIGRDESNTAQAIKDFDRFVSNYPNSPLLDSVAHYQALLMERKAESDYQTARLYYRMDKPRASALYLKEFLDLYPKSKRIPDVMFLLINSYIELDQFDMAHLYLQRAKDSLPATVPDRDKTIAGLDRDITKAEEKFKKNLARERKEKLIQKEEAAESQ